MRVLHEAFLIEWLHAELGRLFPKACAARGPAGMDRFVNAGVLRARGLGLTRDDLLPYLSMEICFGEAFLDIPGNNWARAALAGPAQGRMSRLRRAGIFQLAALAERERRQKAAWAEAAKDLEREQREQEAANA
jgi:hypothetical protein